MGVAEEAVQLMSRPEVEAIMLQASGCCGSSSSSSSSSSCRSSRWCNRPDNNSTWIEGNIRA